MLCWGSRVKNIIDGYTAHTPDCLALVAINAVGKDLMK